MNALHAAKDEWERHAPLFGDPAGGGRNIVGCSADVAHPGPDEDGRAWFAKHLENHGAPDYMVKYWSFWSTIVEPTGKGPDRDAVARELSDYDLVMSEASKVYEELAGLSKPNTAAHHILAGAERRYNETHATLILCDLLPQIDDQAARQAVREYAETLHEGAWEQHQQAEKARAQVRTAKAVEDELRHALTTAGFDPLPLPGTVWQDMHAISWLPAGHRRLVKVTSVGNTVTGWQVRVTADNDVPPDAEPRWPDGPAGLIYVKHLLADYQLVEG